MSLGARFGHVTGLLSIIGLWGMMAATGITPCVQAGSYAVLYNFCSQNGCTDGQSPETGVIRDSAGNLYGTTYRGGTSARGVLYELDPTGKETVLYNFCSQTGCTDGQYPVAGVIRDSVGNLYGTAYRGGRDPRFGGEGVVYKLDSNGQQTVLYSFCLTVGCTDGQWPYDGVIRDSAGNLYGTTQLGGTSGYGVVFKIDTGGKETVLYSFCSLANCTDGQHPFAGVIRDPAGNLYGTTSFGGTSGSGVVFKIDTSGKETVLYNFCSHTACADGESPNAVIRDSAGNLYGTTLQGGTQGRGVVFKVDTSGKETVLYNFCSQTKCTDGQRPYAGVIRDSAGNLYGTTSEGGTSAGGVVYKIDTSGKETVLYNFCSQTNCTDGQYAVAGVIRDAAGNLYGTTLHGGASAGGVVFKLTP